MRHIHGGSVLTLVLALAIAVPAAANDWQGQGRGQGQGQGQGNQGRGNDDRDNARGNQGRGNDDQGNARGNQGRGNDDRDDAPGNRGRGNARGLRDRANVVVLRTHIDRLPEPVRRLSGSSRRGDRIVVGSLARASVRGVDASRFVVESSNNRWIVKNRDGVVLFDLDEDRAERMGGWEMRRLGDRRPTENAPAFCRSGAGHPVWGREWCLERGFGLGVSERSIWSRATIEDVVFKRRPDTGLVLQRVDLIDVLGDIVFGRLAVQSLVLGNEEPLVGRWVASADEPDAPFILRVTAGDVAVAEFVDRDRDEDVDVLFVSQPRW